MYVYGDIVMCICVLVCLWCLALHVFVLIAYSCFVLFIKGSNNHFNNIPSRISLETQEVTTCAAES